MRGAPLAASLTCSCAALGERTALGHRRSPLQRQSSFCGCHRAGWRRNYRDRVRYRHVVVWRHRAAAAIWRLKSCRAHASERSLRAGAPCRSLAFGNHLYRLPRLARPLLPTSTFWRFAARKARRCDSVGRTGLGACARPSPRCGGDAGIAHRNAAACSSACARCRQPEIFDLVADDCAKEKSRQNSGSSMPS
jgi:hypothetical protein